MIGVKVTKIVGGVIQVGQNPPCLDRRGVFGSTCFSAVQCSSSATDEGWQFVPDAILLEHRGGGGHPSGSRKDTHSTLGLQKPEGCGGLCGSTQGAAGLERRVCGGGEGGREGGGLGEVSRGFFGEKENSSGTQTQKEKGEKGQKFNEKSVKAAQIRKIWLRPTVTRLTPSLSARKRTCKDSQKQEVRK